MPRMRVESSTCNGECDVLHYFNFFFVTNGGLSSKLGVEVMGFKFHGPCTSKKFYVPRAMFFKRDCSKLLKIKEVILNK